VQDRRFEAIRQVLGDDARFVRAPGRVNLIGDHTDYQEGFCLPMAIDRDVVVGWRPRPGGRIVVRSFELDGTVDVAAGGTDPPPGVLPPWGRTVAAVVEVLARRGIRAPGLEAVAASTVPVGSGLSSSAAFEVALALAITTHAGGSLGGKPLALAMQSAEHAATGVPCGVMDQMASVFGRSGHALLLDCRSLAVEPIPLPADLDVVVVHSGLPRTLEASAYSERRHACEDAAAALGVRALRDAAGEQVAGLPFARHVVSENARTLAFAEALRRGDVGRLGPLMLESQDSLARDFRVSTPELDLLVQLLVDAGALGARLTGAGFGGCVVALTARGRGATASRVAAEEYRARTGREPHAFVVHAVDGAGVVT
jgi:galactokinase